MSLSAVSSVTPGRDGRSVEILDQTQLPQRTVILTLSTVPEVCDAIRRLCVRGAPAIGIAAAYGLYLGALAAPQRDSDAFFAALSAAKAELASSRPTAVNLFWALDRMERTALSCRALPVPEIVLRLKTEADTMRSEDIDVCRRIGEHGLTLLGGVSGLLTHCNAGRLATIEFGTALAPVYAGLERGMRFHVYADETRPLLQGARLTAYELSAAGADVTVICDNMASYVMKQGLVGAVLVGADRIAANGDTANKIGTSGVAILARHYGIPLYVCAPRSTFDPGCADGGGIVIEQRAPEEITEMWYAKPMTPERVPVLNPAFDVTDAELVSAFVTEYGILRPPYRESIAGLFK